MARRLHGDPAYQAGVNEEKAHFAERELYGANAKIHRLEIEIAGLRGKLSVYEKPVYLPLKYDTDERTLNTNDIARYFHETYERLAPEYGYETRTETREFDAESPNGRLMLAVCKEIATKIEKAAFETGFNTGLREGKNTL